MKIKNTSDFPTCFLRRACSWICGELELPVKYMRAAAFTRTRAAYRGRAWLGSHRILVRIGEETYEQRRGVITINGEPIAPTNTPPEVRGKVIAQPGKPFTNERGEWLYRVTTEQRARYPMNAKYPGRKYAPDEMLADRIEALVHVTAHELAHHERWRSGVQRNHEAGVDGVSFAVLRAFRARREQLLAEWSVPIKQRPKAAPEDKTTTKLAQAQAMLKRWAGKVRRATTWQRKWAGRVKRLELKVAAMGRPTEAP